MKLIPKDAVLAEIDRMFDKHSSKHDIDEAGVVLLQLRENVEKLEVTEVDLETEIERVRKHHYINDDFDKVEIDGRTITNIAKHFFELGLSASNPLTWEDISSLKVLLDEVENEFKKGLHNDKTYIEYCEEVLKRFKAQKGE